MATDDEVRIKLSLLNAAKFKNDADGAARSIIRLGRAAREVGKHAAGFRTGLEGVTRSTKALTQATNAGATSASRYQRGMERSVRTTSSVGRSSRQANSGLAALAGGFGAATGAASRFSTVAAGIGAGLGATTVAAGTFGLKMNADMEVASIAFETMLGSAQKSHAFMEEMKSFAVATPFEYEDVQSAAKQLMAFGFAAEDTLPMLEKIGNTSAALGLGGEGVKRYTYALGQMRAAGNLQGDEIRQLQEVGIPAYQIIAEASGRTVPQVMSDISARLIPSEGAIDALLAYSEKQYGGLMERQSKTLSGLWNAFKEGLKLQSADVMEPVADELKNLLPGAITASSTALVGVGRGVLWLTDRFRGALPTIREFTGAFKNGGIDGVAELMDKKTGGDSFSRMLESARGMGPSLKAIVTDFLIPAAIKFLPFMADALRALEAFVKGIATNGPLLTALFDGLLYLGRGILSVFELIGKTLTIIGKVINPFLSLLGYGQAVETGPAPQGPGLTRGGAPAPATGPLYNPVPYATGITGMANGGVVRRPGLSWVGERGPELLSLPRSARVDPLPEGEGALSVGGDTVIHLNVSGADVLNARRVGEIIVSQIQDQLARR